MAIAPAPQHAGRTQEESQQLPASPSKGSTILSAARAAAVTGVRLAELALGTEGNEKQEMSKPKQLLHSLVEQLREGTLARDAHTLIQGVAQATDPLDDRKMLLEEVIQMLSTLPPDSPIGDTLSGVFIRALWQDLPKPPLTFVGDAKYRTADGSGNNPFMPKLGAAGQAYARSVAPMHLQPDQLPDPGLVFDVLLKRDRFEPHPSGISSLLFNFATLITHSIFNTHRNMPKPTSPDDQKKEGKDRKDSKAGDKDKAEQQQGKESKDGAEMDENINDASSYLDLSPVYGNTLAEQLKVRTMKKGELHPDAVASQRLFLMPPGTIALAVLFSRNHNYIARKLLEINQNGRYTLAKDDDASRKQQDEDLFQTARLINCGHFQNVIFQDYIRVILHVNETMSTWSLVPTNEIKTAIGGELPRGTGNAVSVEFNLLYRWHSSVSERDGEWIERLMTSLINKPVDQMTPDDFNKAAATLFGRMGTNPLKWTTEGLTRTGEDGLGPFRDDDIVEVLTKATDSISGAFGARRVPQIMRVIDVMGMAIARNRWNVCTLNEFRKFLNLTTYKSFSEWNPDPEIAEAARRLYKDIENLELMPGLAAEEAKPSIEGSGLCPGYTISRAILSDAAALVRADRFLTTDYNAGNLTSYQWKDLQPELDNGAFGGTIGKMLMRHFPGHYTFNSTYALFPFTTPHTTGTILRNLKIAERYDASRPTPAVGWQKVHSYEAAKTILEDNKAAFSNVYGAHKKALADVKQEPSFMSHFTAFDTEKKREHYTEMLENVIFPKHWGEKLFMSIGEATRQQIADAGWTYDAKNEMVRLDVVSELIVPIAMNHLAKTLALPMKTKQTPHGFFTNNRLYEMLTDCFVFVYSNYDPSTGYKLREKAKADAEILRSVIEFRIGQVNGTPAPLHRLAVDIKETLTGRTGSGIVLSDHSRAFYEHILEKTNRPFEEIAGVLQTAMVDYITCISAAVSVINFYLKPENREHLNRLQTLACERTGMAPDSAILSYVEEALRIDPPITGVARRAKTATVVQDGKNTVQIQKDQLVWVDLVAANHDEKKWENPMEVNVSRPPKEYQVMGKYQGLTSDANESYNTHFVGAILRELLIHPRLARVEGKAGDLGRIKGPLGTHAYLRENQVPAAFPVSMQIQFCSNKNAA